MLQRQIENYSRVINDELAVWVPACKGQIGVFVQIRDHVAIELRADPALGLVFEFCVLGGQLLNLGVAAAVFEVSGV